MLPLLASSIMLFPLLALVWLGGALLVGYRPSERSVSRVTGASLGAALLLGLATFGGMVLDGREQLVVHLGEGFQAGGYEFPLTLLVDRLSLPFALLTCTLTGLVGRFSASYLHREEGFHRFYVLMLLFASAMLLLVMAGTIDLLYAGWELVGISSALLIAFFHRRKGPVLRGLRAFAIYRVCDTGLLVAAVLIHHYAHSSGFHGDAPWPDGGGLSDVPPAAATGVALLLVLASLGKSAQLPFSGWLPRAMEGPTPSSAIFYGGLSIHAGAYMLLRTSAVLDKAPLAAAALVTVGLLTAVYATFVGRVQSDAKNQLAYASMVQVGIILAEIGLGLRTLALVHIAGHAVVRTLQMLRAPSLLRDFNRIDAAAGGQLARTGLFYERLLPARLRRWLYSLALARGGVDAALDRFVAEPVLRVARVLDRLEHRWVELVSRGLHWRRRSAASPGAHGKEAER
jgi:NADH:ubiquinone oxidoreductase subunit 5 (subunit L)/multisubunit Na+/H+ antiporter MnhA subunit